MSAADLLARLRAAGLSVLAKGDNLVLRPPEALTAALRAEVLAAKAELLAVLRAADPVPPVAPLFSDDGRFQRTDDRAPTGPPARPVAALPTGAGEWLAARTDPVPGCCVGVGDAVADFAAFCPAGDPLALVHALEAGAVPGVRISETANGARLVLGLKIGDFPILNATGPGARLRRPRWAP